MEGSKNMYEVNNLIKHAIEQANANMNFEELSTDDISLLRLEQEVIKDYYLVKEPTYGKRPLSN
ncbi:MAG: hypothetical protein RSC85_01060 [Bacilli bacterium]